MNKTTKIDATEPVEPRTIRTSRIKALFYLFGGIALVWICTHAVKDSASQSGLIAVKLMIAGWGGVFLFGLSALGGAILLISPRALILDGSGLAISGSFVRSPVKIAWRDVQGFYVRKQKRYKSIGVALRHRG
ncbi:STM3941 family protein [Mesorhizobium sp. B2-4-15]|uniref:STM3941 family protein n=1 Tax=Mesorhizobium sp. B2-4-15 TaxID=2589934 RepID=UPI0015EF0A03|nr:STM3941 family protein [Mesorhizobium sp. B2-4-15]